MTCRSVTDVTDDTGVDNGGGGATAMVVQVSGGTNKKTGFALEKIFQPWRRLAW